MEGWQVQAWLVAGGLPLFNLCYFKLQRTAGSHDRCCLGRVLPRRLCRLLPTPTIDCDELHTCTERCMYVHTCLSRVCLFSHRDRRPPVRRRKCTSNPRQRGLARRCCRGAAGRQPDGSQASAATWRHAERCPGSDGAELPLCFAGSRTARGSRRNKAHCAQPTPSCALTTHFRRGRWCA